LRLRLAAVVLVVACAAIASAPAARGSAPTIAVTEFANDAGASQATLDAVGNAAYAALGQGGKYSPVGGGPIKAQSSTGGDLIVSALDAAKKVGAEELITADLLSASGGTITYRLSAYRVDPLAFIRSGTFTQSSMTPASLTAGFATNIATLHAPRTASGTIYSLDQGVKGDFGEATGAQLGDLYNVVRDGQKVAQAKVVGIDLNSANLEIINATAGYKPKVGDQLVGVGPQPAIPPAAHTGANTFSIWALAAATGAALLALGSNHGQGATIGPKPSPTSTIIGGFAVSPTGQSGSPPNESFTFNFSQPVNTSGITFATPTFVSFGKTNGGTVIVPPNTPVTILGGPYPTFSSGNQTLTINATTLLPNDKITFTFNSTIVSTFGVALTPTNVSFTASAARIPAARAHAAPPAAHGKVVTPGHPKGKP
jgi:hypothetical protein